MKAKKTMLAIVLVSAMAVASAQNTDSLQRERNERLEKDATDRIDRERNRIERDLDEKDRMLRDRSDKTDKDRDERDREREAKDRLERERDRIERDMDKEKTGRMERDKDESERARDTKDKIEMNADDRMEMDRTYGMEGEKNRNDRAQLDRKDKNEMKKGSAELKREVSGGFQNPESVIAHKKHLFVTNLGSVLDPMAKDGDGYISKLKRKNGEMIEERFITGLHSPKGMFVKRGVLHIADVDRVVAYNVKKKKKVWEADLTQQGVSYANDLTNVAGGLLVSSTDNNAIYKVCRSGKVKELKVKGDLSGVNGLVRGARKVYVANYGRGESPSGGFGKIKLGGKKYKEFHNGGVYDGIARIPGRLVLTDWTGDNAQGRLVTYRPVGKKFQEVNIDRTFDGPADLYRDRKNRTVWIPVMRENKLIALSFADVKRK